VKREILVSSTAQEAWVVLLEDGQLVELMLDRPDRRRIVGNVYLGRVESVLPGIQAAFVDIGMGKAGFLHASDASPGDWEEDEDLDEGDSGGRRPQRKVQPIQEVLKRGDELLVQVTKEPISTKGSRLTAEISLPGRSLVYMPFSSHVGVSRKIDDREERTRLRGLASGLITGAEGGMIVRTAGEEVTQATMKAEFSSLAEVWKRIKKARETAKAPANLHHEATLVSGVIRDQFTGKFDALQIDDADVFREVRDYVARVDPDLMDRVTHHTEKESLFDKYGIEEEIQKIFQPKVDLPSGGHIVIESTEALVTVDVNTGRFTGRKRKDPEHTILKTNIDAAKEIARQIRLRDVGGIIVCDFIDMDSQENRDRVLHELRSHLGRDRARTKTFAVSELGLIEMTRQRVRPPLFQALSELCSHCEGTGRQFTPSTVIRRIERSLRRAGASGQEKSIQIRVHPEVALRVLETEPKFVDRLQKRTGLELILRDDPLVREDAFRFLSGPAETEVTARYAAM